MNRPVYFFIFVLLLAAGRLFAQGPASFSKHIKIDQFGYLPDAKKVAVIVDPQTGYNAAAFFNPGTGTNQYQVRQWNTGTVVFSGTLAAWNSGNTQAQSGDKGWWFDFSTLTTPGSYYVYDMLNNTGSYRFEINANVYADALKHAMRMYFYQRVNFAKQPPYTDIKWADGAAFGGVNQDYAARSRYDKTNPLTAKDVHGGWFDAGDCNKYTTFTLLPVNNLLEAYRMYPSVFTDNYNIPESGNGIPDLLDEVKWELDWLMRMQQATGTNGLLLKVGADNYNGSSPPSTDNNPRYYVPECTSATLTGAANFALASTVYKSLSNTAMQQYGDTLLARAVRAWNRAKVTTTNFTVFQTACDDQNIVSGDADMDATTQMEMVITAAAYLYEATADTAYRSVFNAHYAEARPIAYYWWGPYYQAVQRALLRYCQLPGATVSVANNIRSVKAAQNDIMSINDYNAHTDLYRAHMPDDQYTWGSNETKASAGLDNLDFAYFNVNPGQASLYRETGSEYLHWFHGLNPMGKVMLTNMYAYGGDSCVNEIYHSWFGDGTVWDNALTSPNGPAPGYIPGGPNKNFTIPAINPPGQQPPQKSFREWNTGWNGTANENSWEITEPAIYTQSAYVSLLARVLGSSPSIPLPIHFITLKGKRTEARVLLQWEVEHSNTPGHFEIERSADGKQFNVLARKACLNGVSEYEAEDESTAARTGTWYYRIRKTDEDGVSAYSNIMAISGTEVATPVVVYPNPAARSVTITGAAQAGEPVSLAMENIYGQVVRKDQWTGDGHYAKIIPVADLSAGVYVLKIKTGNSEEKIRFVKQ